MLYRLRQVVKKNQKIRLIVIKLKFLLNLGLERDAKILKKMKFNTTVDIGANNGYFTNLLLKVSKKVISFEPITYLYQLNLKLFINKNVTFYNLALGDKESYGKINIPRDNDPESSLINKFKNSDIQKVKISTGDKILQNKKIDFIKIDVEGYELFVLKGLKKVIKKDLPIFLIEIEKRHNKNFKDIFYYMINHNYEIFYLNKNNKLKIIKIKSISKFIDQNQNFEKYKINTYLNNFWFINNKNNLTSYIKDRSYF
jgi:FkbM family methyltransferase